MADLTTALTHLARLRRYVTGEELHHTEAPTELTDAADAVERALRSTEPKFHFTHEMCKCGCPLSWHVPHHAHSKLSAPFEMCGCYESLNQPSAWIPCSERMPEDEAPVWIYEDGWIVTEAYLERGLWRAPEGWRHNEMRPTHWAPRYVQPRPDPPNEHLKGEEP